MKTVTQAEYDQFIASYPRSLEVFVNGEVTTHLDFTLGRWPAHEVARKEGDVYKIKET